MMTVRNALGKDETRGKYGAGTNNTGSGDGWVTVTNKKARPKYRYAGQMGRSTEAESKFKAAETKIPIFITNVHTDTLESDIVEYIFRKTNETVVLQKLNIKRGKEHHNAFKFFIAKHKLPVFLDAQIWPPGVIFRRFAHYKPMIKTTKTLTSTALGQDDSE
ncbi:unnamed protein product [Arctia plantaginis]|uniref:Uncharacterized protein n=1 Tax=Arctia plantaginis TaxID=874455 RepID=A0A8S1B7R2_ARCPL|nr:unnamed protein product [Arctia plantaginis]